MGISFSKQTSKYIMDSLYPAGKAFDQLTSLNTFSLLPKELISYIFYLLLTDEEIGYKPDFITFSQVSSEFNDIANDVKLRSTKHMQKYYALIDDISNYVRLCSIGWFSKIDIKSKDQLVKDIKKVVANNPNVTLFADKKSALQAQETRQEHGTSSYFQDEHQPTCFEVVSPRGCLNKDKQYKINDFFKNKTIHSTAENQGSKEIEIDASAFIKSKNL